ncbi:YjgP/YjgQ family permease [Sphingomonas sp. ID1715]|nr:YjgP/YjgQ family permease [Sphingomonas sp. ID1715]
MGQAYLLIAATMFLLMIVEHLPRLLSLARDIDRTALFIGESLASLFPEYLGLGLVVALFLSTALTFRRMALTSELEIWSAAGVSDFRLLRVPIILGCATAILVLGVRLYAQPLGETNLQRIGEQARAGDYGLGLPPKDILTPSENVTLTFDHVDRRAGRFEGVFAQVDNAIIVAQSGSAGVDRQDQLLLTLRDGVVLKRKGVDERERTAFRVLSLAIPRRGARAADPVANVLDQRDLIQLMHLVRAAPMAGERSAAKAAIHGRLAMGAFTILLPFLGFVLGTPPLRESSAFGIFAGLILIAGYVRASAGIEGSLAAVSLAANGLILSGFAAATVLLFRLHSRMGRGFIDRFAGRLLARMTRRLNTRRQKAEMRSEVQRSCARDEAQQIDPEQSRDQIEQSRGEQRLAVLGEYEEPDDGRSGGGQADHLEEDRAH